MATYTPTLNLKKPAQSDAASILDINGNMDTIDMAIANMWNTIYPVGAIYMSTNSTSPATLFGGTWARIKDMFLLAAGDSYSVGGTGGSATHTLGTTNLPSHAHGLNGHTHSLNNHTHSLNNHVHGLGNHTHTLTSHTHGVGTLSIGSDGTHKHPITGLNSRGSVGSYYATSTKSGDWGVGNTMGEDIISIGNAGAHTHKITGNTGADGSGNTGVATGNTGTASGNTGTCNDQTGGNTGNTTYVGNGTPVNHMPPYYTVYMWRRTA